ncbi:uncharacterized protein B4U79_04967, partial [Dinothrombium tinctorium]
TLKAELQRIRKRGALKPGLDQSRVCARCLTELGRIINRGAFCPICRKKVCKTCRFNGEDEKIWVCIVCQKQIQLKVVSGEWMRELSRSASEKLRSPSSKAITSAKETIEKSFRQPFKAGFSPQGSFSQSKPTPEDGEEKQVQSNVNTSEARAKTRGILPPKLPTVDYSSFQRYSPPASAGSSGGSQDSSPKPPMSPVLKAYQTAVELVTDRKNSSPIVQEKETIYRKVSNKLQDSSSSEEEVESSHTSFRATKSSESTPSPRTPNSYRILSQAHHQATAFKFPPSPYSSRPPSNDRQSSDEFSTTQSSLRSRSTSSEMNDDSALAPQPMPRTRRISPLRKQRAIAEEISGDASVHFATEYPSTSGADSGVSDCNLISPKAFQQIQRRTCSSEDEESHKKLISEDSDSSSNEPEEGTVEKTTGYLFRKVTVKRRGLENVEAEVTSAQRAGTCLSDQRNFVQKSKSEGKCANESNLFSSDDTCIRIIDAAISNASSLESKTRSKSNHNSFISFKNPFSSFKTTKTLIKPRDSLHEGCNSCCSKDRYLNHTLTTSNTTYKNDANDDCEPERHFIKRKQLSLDSPTKRKIKKLSDRAKRLRDRIIPCKVPESHKGFKMKSVKSPLSKIAEYDRLFAANFIARSASLPNNYCNRSLEDSCNLSFRSSSVDNKLWDHERESNLDTQLDMILNMHTLVPEYNEYRLVFMDTGSSISDICDESCDFAQRDRTLRVRSHIEINNGTVYVEDSDWEMCSELGDEITEEYSKELNVDGVKCNKSTKECDRSGATNSERRERETFPTLKTSLVETSEDGKGTANESVNEKHFKYEHSFAAKNVQIIKNFALGAATVKEGGNEPEIQVNNSQQVVTPNRYIHTKMCQLFESSEKEKYRSNNSSLQCIGSNSLQQCPNHHLCLLDCEDRQSECFLSTGFAATHKPDVYEYCKPPQHFECDSHASGSIGSFATSIASDCFQECAETARSRKRVEYLPSDTSSQLMSLNKAEMSDIENLNSRGKEQVCENCVDVANSREAADEVRDFGLRRVELKVMEQESAATETSVRPAVTSSGHEVAVGARVESVNPIESCVYSASSGHTDDRETDVCIESTNVIASNLSASNCTLHLSEVCALCFRAVQICQLLLPKVSQKQESGKELCSSAIKLGVNVDDVKQQFALNDEFHNRSDYVKKERAVCCNTRMLPYSDGGEMDAATKRVVKDCEKVFDTLEETLMNESKYTHSATVPPIFETHALPTQIKLQPTNENSFLNEVTAYDCGPPRHNQSAGDCTHNASGVLATVSDDNATYINNTSPHLTRDHSASLLLTLFCESLVMESLASAEQEVLLKKRDNKKSVCFGDNFFIPCETEDERLCENIEFVHSSNYYINDSDHFDNQEHGLGEMCDSDNEELYESLVDVKDEYKDSLSTSSEEEVYRNYEFESSHQLNNYGNPLAYTLHTIIEESESESLPATPADSQSSRSESDSFQTDTNNGNDQTTRAQSDRSSNESIDACDIDLIALASSRLKLYLETGIFDPCLFRHSEQSQECSHSNNKMPPEDKAMSEEMRNEKMHSHNESLSKGEQSLNNESRTRNLEGKVIIDNEEDGRESVSKYLQAANAESNEKSHELITPLEALESQITRLMLAVSPENNSVGDNNSICGSALESNNSDYGSDVIELTEYSSDEDRSHNLLNRLTGKSPGIKRRESERSIAASAKSTDSTISEDTMYICQHLMDSLKKLTELSLNEDNSSEQSDSDFARAKEYIKDQIIALMHTVQSSSLQNSPLRQRRRENKSKTSCACNLLNDEFHYCDDSECGDVCTKSENTKKSPSESGSETISVSVSIPSYDDSDNTAAECEISHEMEELFSMINDSSAKDSRSNVNFEEDNSSLKSWEARISLFSNVKAATETEDRKREASDGKAADNLTVCESQEITVNGKEIVEANEGAESNCFSFMTNSHKTVVKIDEGSLAENVSPMFESLKDRSFSSDSVSSIQTVKARNVNLTTASGVLSELSSEENVCTSRLTVDEDKSETDQNAGVSRKSFNSKEKASSENNLLVVNLMSQAKTSNIAPKVASTKSAGNISDIEQSCNKNTFRDTGYYSFKSSEESIKSLEERTSPTISYYNALSNCKMQHFTETILEVEEEQDTATTSNNRRRFTPSSNVLKGHSLSSSNIPDDIFKGSKTNSLPMSSRNNSILQPLCSQRARSSFFSTSGVLRKLNLLRDDKSSVRKLRAKVRTSSGGNMCSSAGGAVPQISVSDYSESYSTRGSIQSPLGEIGQRDDDFDGSLAQNSRSQTSLSSIGIRSESLSSIYSAAGGGRYGFVNVSGEILFSLSYNYKTATMEVTIKECRNLAAVDKKRNRSDPYVKVYLLPDRTKAGKRKTKVKRHTLDPIFDEVFKFNLPLSEISTRTLWISVWHSDIFGRNDFLGEVTLPIGRDVFKNSSLKWFPLQDKIDSTDHLSKGDLFVALKFVPFDTTHNKHSRRINKGTLHVLVKEAHNLMPTRSNGTADPFCKCYLLPDRSKMAKQKTAVIKKTCDPKWNYTFVYDDIELGELKDRCLELTVWDYDKLTSNDFLGGVRLSLGLGKYCGQEVDWMDSVGEEVNLWQNMLDRPNMWVYGTLRLRPTLESRHK